jgi:signal peptidase I
MDREGGVQTERSEVRAVVTSRLTPETLGELLERLLRDGWPVELAVTGASMTPCIRSGDVVTLQPETAPRRGDVIATRDPASRLRVHRVIRIRERTLQTRGDAAASPDPETRADDVLGRVVSIERMGRRVRFGLGPGRGLLAALSAAGWLAPALQTLSRLSRRWGPR